MKKFSVVSPFVIAGGLLLLSPQALLPRAHADWVMVKIQASFDVSGEGQETNPPASHAPWTGATQTRVFESPAYPTNSGGGSGISLGDRVSFIIPPSPYAASGGRGGKAVASVKGYNFKAFLEWRGSGTPTDECYLRLRTQTEASVAGVSSSLPKWRYSLSDGAGAVKEDHKYDNTLPLGSGYAAYYEWLPSFKGGGWGSLLSQKFIRLDTSSRTLRADGVYGVEKTLDISPVAEAALSTSYGGGDPAEHADATTRMDAVLVTRSVIITSDLGQTFRKSLTQPPTQPGQTPLAPILGSSPPVWRVPVAPEATQESAAQWLPNPTTSPNQRVSASYGWYGMGIYTAKVAGLITPSYAWNLSGGTFYYQYPTGSSPLGRDTPTVDLGYATNDAMVTWGQGLGLGGEAGGTGMTKSSTLDVTVTGTNVSDPSTPLKDSYTVNWHPDYERLSDLPSVSMSYRSGTTYPVPTYPALTIQEEQPRTIDVSVGFEGLAGAIGAYAGGPGGALVATGAAASIAQGLSGTFDLTWEIGGTPEYTFTNGSDSWIQVQANNPGNVSNPTWFSDPNGFANFNVTMVRMTRWERKRWLCDEYDGHGFVGPERVLAKDMRPTTQFEPFYTLIPGRPTAPPTGGPNP